MGICENMPHNLKSTMLLIEGLVFHDIIIQLKYSPRPNITIRVRQNYSCNWDHLDGNVYFINGVIIKHKTYSLEESLSITTIHCDLAIATHARKMHN